jgi:hypothetical protein
MSTLFVILIVMAIFHFTYEGIFLPTRRLKLRYDLFELRDKLRRLKANKENKISDELYGLIQSSIDNSIKMLPFATVTLVVKATIELKDSENLRKEISKRIALINNCEVKEIQTIFNKSKELLANAFIINTLPLIIYMLPIAFVLWIIFNVFNKAKRLYGYIISFPYSSEDEIDKLTSGCPAVS